MELLKAGGIFANENLFAVGRDTLKMNTLENQQIVDFKINKEHITFNVWELLECNFEDGDTVIVGYFRGNDEFLPDVAFIIREPFYFNLFLKEGIGLQEFLSKLDNLRNSDEFEMLIDKHFPTLERNLVDYIDL